MVFLGIDPLHNKLFREVKKSSWKGAFAEDDVEMEKGICMGNGGAVLCEHQVRICDVKH